MRTSIESLDSIHNVIKGSIQAFNGYHELSSLLFDICTLNRIHQNYYWSMLPAAWHNFILSAIVTQQDNASTTGLANVILALGKLEAPLFNPETDAGEVLLNLFCKKIHKLNDNELGKCLRGFNQMQLPSPAMLQLAIALDTELPAFNRCIESDQTITNLKIMFGMEHYDFTVPQPFSVTVRQMIRDFLTDISTDESLPYYYQAACRLFAKTSTRLGTDYVNHSAYYNLIRYCLERASYPIQDNEDAVMITRLYIEALYQLARASQADCLTEILQLHLPELKVIALTVLPVRIPIMLHEELTSTLGSLSLLNFTWQQLPEQLITNTIKQKFCIPKPETLHAVDPSYKKNIHILINAISRLAIYCPHEVQDLLLELQPPVVTEDKISEAALSRALRAAAFPKPGKPVHHQQEIPPTAPPVTAAVTEPDAVTIVATNHNFFQKRERIQPHRSQRKHKNPIKLRETEQELDKAIIINRLNDDLHPLNISATLEELLQRNIMLQDLPIAMQEKLYATLDNERALPADYNEILQLYSQLQMNPGPAI